MAFDAYLIVLSICAASVFYWYLTNTFDYWRKRNVKCVPAYPIVGTQGEFLTFKSQPSIVAQRIYNRYPHEKVVGGFLSRTPELLIRDLDLIKLIFIKDFHHFTDHLFNFDGQREPLTENLLFSKGDLWKKLRKKLTPTFTSGKMKNMFPLINECGKKFQRNLTGCEKSEGQEIRELMAKFTMDVIGTCVFGLELNIMNNENSQFRKMGAKVFEPSVARGLKILLKQISDSTYDFFNINFFSKEVETFFLEIVKSILQSRNYEPSQRHDFLDLLIELRNNNSSDGIKCSENETDEMPFTDNLIAAQAFILFNAGFETSSTTMGFALYEIAKNPVIQQRIKDETEKVLAKHLGVLTYEAFDDMKYLDMVIDETLRKYPPFGVLDRVCTMAYNFSDLGFSIDERVVVKIPVYAIHHDPQYFPDPEEFIPERFTVDAKESRHPFSYLPFGGGPRKCIAQRFGKLQIKVGLIFLLQNYIVKANSRTEAKISFQPKTFVLRSEYGIWLTLIPRLTSIEK